MLALRIITATAMAITLMGVIASSERDKRPFIIIFTVAGALLFLSIVVERIS